MGWHKKTQADLRPGGLTSAHSAGPACLEAAGSQLGDKVSLGGRVICIQPVWDTDHFIFFLQSSLPFSFLTAFPPLLAMVLCLSPASSCPMTQGPLRVAFSSLCLSCCLPLGKAAFPVEKQPCLLLSPGHMHSSVFILCSRGLSFWTFCVGRHFIGGWGFITNFSYIGKKRSCFSHWIQGALHHPDALVLIWARSLVTESCSFGGDSCQMEMSF